MLVSDRVVLTRLILVFLLCSLPSIVCIVLFLDWLSTVYGRLLELLQCMTLRWLLNVFVDLEQLCSQFGTSLQKIPTPNPYTPLYRPPPQKKKEQTKKQTNKKKQQQKKRKKKHIGVGASLSALAVATLVWEAGERKPTPLFQMTTRNEQGTRQPNRHNSKCRTLCDSPPPARGYYPVEGASGLWPWTASLSNSTIRKKHARSRNWPCFPCRDEGLFCPPDAADPVRAPRCHCIVRLGINLINDRLVMPSLIHRGEETYRAI